MQTELLSRAMSRAINAIGSATVIAAAARKKGGAYDNHVTGVNTTHLPGISNGSVAVRIIQGNSTKFPMS